MRLMLIILVCLLAAIAVGRALDWRKPTLPAGHEAATDALPEIRITGPGNTLASVANEINDPRRLTYDPIARRAILRTGLTIEGEFQMGREDDPTSGEILEIPVEIASMVKVNVLSGGHFRMYHSTVRSSEDMKCTTCASGWAFSADGSITMVDSQMLYHSGIRSYFLQDGAEATIRRSSLKNVELSALRLRTVDGLRIAVEDCDLVTGGKWGLAVDGSGGEPLEFRNCILQGLSGALQITGQSARVRLIDCSLAGGNIQFETQDGEVTVAWTRRVKVVDELSGAPKAGVAVHAESMPGSAVPIRVEGRTGPDGVAELVLIDWIARPDASTKRAGLNNVGEIRISVGEDSAGSILADTVVRVEGRNQTPIEFAVSGGA